MVRDRFTRLQEGFAMVRGKIARKRQIFAAWRAIKTAKWRLFQLLPFNDLDNEEKNVSMRGDGCPYRHDRLQERC